MRRKWAAVALLSSTGWMFLHCGQKVAFSMQAPAPARPSKVQGYTPTRSHCLAGAALVAITLRCPLWRPDRRRAARSAGLKLFGPEGPTVLLSSASIGVATGCAVVVFELIIKELEELREELPLPVVAPILGALALAAIFTAFGGKDNLAGTDIKSLKSYAAAGGPEPPENWPLRAAFNALSAALTLGSGNSLGPEAPAATLGP
ncbi:unnamed protein product, partial [Effrenium voratum]